MVKPELEELATELNSVAIHLVRRLRRTDEQLGVSAARLSALSVLVFGGPRSLSELAEAEQVTAPTMTRIVQGLEQQGLVARESHPTDGRSVRLTPTAKGRKVMLRGRDLRVAQLTADLETLPAADVAALRRAATVLRKLER